jgi:hypothetical protein
MQRISAISWLQFSSTILLFYLTIAFTGCKKEGNGKKLILTGKITDDIMGVGISGGGAVKVDGYNANPVGLLATDRKKNIGNGTINDDGSFTVSFSQWTEATTYEFYFFYPDKAYINNGNNYLNTSVLSSNLFSSGSFNMNITAAKITELQINFRNTSPINTDDSLHISFPDNNVQFYFLMPRWENLQNCVLGTFGGIKGGNNARGTLKCNVPADRKFNLKWLARKNGVTQNFSDSISCPRNTTTLYTLNY